MSVLKLKSVEIEGFRGYDSPRRLDFSKPIAVLFGRNGSGKSSTLMAIEWCLFGDVAYLLHLEGRSRDELVNQFTSLENAKVTLGIISDSARYQITRSKKVGSTKTEVQLTTPNGEYREEEAEQKLFQLIGVTIDDFVRSTYLHQESIKGLLLEDTASRDEAMDRLFGLERIRNIVESIPIKKVRQTVEGFDQKKSTLSRKIEGAIEQSQLDLNRLREKAAELGIPKGDINIDLASKISVSIVRSLEKLSSEYGLPSSVLSAPSDASQVDSFERKVKQVLREYEVKIIGTSKITELNSDKSKLEDLSRRSKKNSKAFDINHDQINDLIAKFGKPEDISNQLHETEKKIQDCEDQRNQIDVRSRLVEDAITVLQTSTLMECPVCNQPIEITKVLKQLQDKTRHTARESVIMLENKRLELVRKKNALEDALTQANRMFEQEKEIVNDAKTLLQEASVTLGTPVSTHQDLFDAVKLRLSQIEVEVSEFNNAYAKRAATFDTIRSDLEKIAATGDVVKKETEFAEINSHFKSESDEIRQLESAIAELQMLEERLSTIVRIAGQLQVGLAARMIGVSQQGVESYYKTLCNHQAYDRLQIDVRPRDIRGMVKNSYSIKAYSSKLDKETFVSTRFSSGQMNCVALSICFALTRSLPLKLGFLILDDPSQSLDEEHKEALAEILSQISQEKQVILATQDDELLKLIQSSLTSTETLEFVGWSIDGPEITSR